MEYVGCLAQCLCPTAPGEAWLLVTLPTFLLARAHVRWW